MTVTVENEGGGLLSAPPPGTVHAASPAADQRVPRPGAGRDRFLDVIRLLVMALVVMQHWWLPVLAQDQGVLEAGSVLETEGGFALTWVVQVMPLIFFVGGAANLISWRSASDKGVPASTWYARRLRRLAWPVVPLAIVWITASHLLVLSGAPAESVLVGSGAAGMVLWFLAVYVLVVVATPVLFAAQERFGWWVPAALLAGAVAVDAVRYGTGADWVGYLNIAFVWLGIHQLGFRYATGAIRLRYAAMMAVGGGVAALALVLFGPYSVNMTGVFAAETSNVSPPTLVLGSLGVLQIGVAVLLRERISAWSDRPGPARMLDRVCPQLMTVYLWHMIPVSVVAGVLVFGLGIDTPAPLTGTWLLWGVLGLAVLLPMIAPLAHWAVRFENPPKALSGSPGMLRVLVAAALIGGGMLILTVSGLGVGLAPLLGLLAVLSGLMLTRAPVRV
ncbi:MULTISPECIES: acyltransferase family protein [Nocardiopsidaceae]|uniref:Acyltransferase n=1 Tax=Streptomonospora nanhaiensis TaxID=1323731 RepID=A0ABY6YMA3_9ACTN|nr:acyltransferase [Streptomonospora nanhaiensis]WAE73350.1 acyltransferase [Streptomonospora nanhaiensis]